MELSPSSSYSHIQIQRTEAKVCHIKSFLSLTAWVASEDISSGFIVQEDEEGIREGTEPPTWPEVDGWMDGQMERKTELQLECDKFE